MSNRHYLTLIDQKIICPGYRDEATYQSKSIGEAGWYIPFLWFAMFREADLVEDNFISDHGSVRAFAPVTAVESAIRNLASAYEVLSNEISVDSNLLGYFELTQEELHTASLPFITIDWLESLEEEGFEGDLLRWRLILRGFEDPGVISEKPPSVFARLFGRKDSCWVKAVRHYSDFDPRSSLPPARALLDNLPLSDSEVVLHARLLPGGSD